MINVHELTNKIIDAYEIVSMDNSDIEDLREAIEDVINKYIKDNNIENI